MARIPKYPNDFERNLQTIEKCAKEAGVKVLIFSSVDINSGLDDLGYSQPSVRTSLEILEAIEDELQQECGRIFKNILEEHLEAFASEHELKVIAYSHISIEPEGDDDDDEEMKF